MVLNQTEILVVAPKPPQPNDDLRFPGSWSLTDAAKGRLCLFLDRVEDFRRYGYFGFPVEASFTFAEGKLKVEAQLPGEMLLRSAVLAARHFVLENSNPTQLFSILNLLRKSTSEPRFHKKIDAAREAWRRLLDEEVRWGDPSIRRKRDLFGAYANGHYLHSDPAFRAFLRKASEGIGPMLKQQFAQMLHQMFHEVNALTPIVKNALQYDLLAPGPEEEQVRSIVESSGGPRGPIKIQVWQQDPSHGFRSGVNCHLEFAVEDAVVNRVLGPIHRLLVEGHPGLEDYAIHWFNTEPDYRFVCLDEGGRSLTPLDRAFNHAIRAVQESSPLLGAALAEVQTEAERASRSASNRGDAVGASELMRISQAAREAAPVAGPRALAVLAELREGWIRLRDRR